ncbi:MAG TPA: aldolase/citrate lyase family protein [Geminicoccaceae bacterium]|nr:aldolase/citrate lyase family protein [Geminicoccaceae bacterium]
MAGIRNIAKERLEAGELAIGVGLRQARTVDIAKIMKTAGYDFLFIDCEHSALSVDVAGQISTAAQDAGITPIVRVPGMQHFHASRALDAGAQGIVVPHVDTAEIAAQMAEQCRYPPRGRRSVTGALPQIDFASWPLGEATAAIDAATLVVVMIETPRAVANVNEIAAVPGVDVLLVGANDLCLEMGIPGQLDHPRVVEAFERITAACRASGKHAGLGGVYTPPLIEGYVGMGFRFILAGSDLSFMLAAAKERAAAVRAMSPR